MVDNMELQIKFLTRHHTTLSLRLQFPCHEGKFSAQKYRGNVQEFLSAFDCVYYKWRSRSRGHVFTHLVLSAVQQKEKKRKYIIISQMLSTNDKTNNNENNETMPHWPCCRLHLMPRRKSKNRSWETHSRSLLQSANRTLGIRHSSQNHLSVNGMESLKENKRVNCATIVLYFASCVFLWVKLS